MLASLRQAARPLITAGLRSFSTAPKVIDSMVAITAFLDGSSIRVLAKEGTKLNQALTANPHSALACVQLSPVEGADCPVDIPAEFLAIVAPMCPEDIDFIKTEVASNPSTIGKNTRLASKVILTPCMNGMTVAIHSIKPQTVL